MRLCLVSYMLQLDGQIPIGLLTLAEIARQEGVDDIRVLDLPMRREEAEFVRSIRDCDVVGFSSICSTYNQTVRLCRRLKEINPTVLLLLGGPQASLTAQASLAAFPSLTPSSRAKLKRPGVNSSGSRSGVPSAGRKSRVSPGATEPMST